MWQFREMLLFFYPLIRSFSGVGTVLALERRRAAAFLPSHAVNRRFLKVASGAETVG